MHEDTIAALATPFGEGAIAVVRVSGPGAVGLGGRVLRAARPGQDWQPRQAVRATVVTADGAGVDDVLATWFPAPASYTGEHVLEISGHGGVLVAQRVLAAVLAAGARPAEPGEFTQRAFLNGKLELTQAEAVMDLIQARSSLALAAAKQQLDGALGRETMDLRASLIEVTAQLEAYIDFPEEDIDPDTGASLTARIRAVLDRVGQLLATADRGRILREGLSTAIIGAPNVGKSSLLNYLCGEDRAIVSERPGTTRDTVETFINLRGVPLRLIDTAGLRESTDDIERLGMERSRAALAAADLVLWVVDGSRPAAEAGAAPGHADHTNRLLVIHKSDLPRHDDWSGSDGVPVSSLRRTGVEQLAERVRQLALGSGAGIGSQLPAINARHQACLGRGRSALTAAVEAMEQGIEPEFVAADLRAAMTAIGEVTGRIDADEVLGEIFGRFCIGK